MGIGDKIKNAAEDLKGKAQEATGKATDNRDLEAEGKGTQSSADAKKAGENLKDGDFGDAAGNAKDALNN